MSQPSHGRLALALPGAFVAMVLMFGAMAPCAAAEEPGVPRYRLGLELKANWRDSKDTRVLNPFRFDMLGFNPPLPRAFLTTVDPGSHAEISVVTLRFEANWSELWAARVKLDFIDRYDRNPTATGDELDIDEAWLRWGREIDGGGAPSDRRAVYAKLGKFGKFERQDDRHLESYGMMSTAFNRFEDIGIELGIDFTHNLYAKVAYTQGNPLFFRDFNALAGDNGLKGSNFANLPEFDRDRAFEFNRGFPVFYDADIDFEDVDFEKPELGLGIGWRWSSDRVVGDFLAWAYRRELAETIELDGTFYHGDLDLLLGPLNLFSLAVKDDDKAEVGANLWLYRGGFSLFAQYVDQDLAGLLRDGFEVEAAWSFELPLWVAAGGRQLFPWIAPAVRYSELNSDILDANPNPLNPFPYPAPSVKWDWTKLDLGLRLGLWENMDLTVEWADVEAETASGPRDFDEFLLTLRLGFERGWGE